MLILEQVNLNLERMRKKRQLYRFCVTVEKQESWFLARIRSFTFLPFEKNHQKL